MKVIELTHSLNGSMPVYPGIEPPKFTQSNFYEKDGFRETYVQFFTHTGTHVDPPAHLYAEGRTLDAFPPEQFIGKALVIDCRALKEGEAITMEQLKKYGELPQKADFLLFNLGWDKRWGTEAYFGDYPCVDDELLEYIINGNFKGIGFDVIGLDPIADVELTRHNKLLRSCEILNIENLKNLDRCGDGLFWFGCFPLKIENSDGAPVRAMAWFE